MEIADISWIGVLAGALAFFVLGYLWYGPIFGNSWRQLVGVPADAEPQGPAPKILISAFVLGLFSVAALAAILGTDPSLAKAVLIGAVVGALLPGAALGTQYLFEGRPLKLWLINLGYNVVGLALAGLILSFTQ